MKRVAGALLALILAVSILAWLSLDLLVQRGIERGAREATGLSTRIESVRLGLFGGELRLRGLTLRNPEGFRSPFLFQLDHLLLEARPRSLFQSTVHVPRLVIRGARLHLERSGTKTNLDPLIARLHRGGNDPAGSQRRFIIDQLRITEVSAEARLAEEVQAEPQQVALEPILLRNVGADTGGVTASQLSRLVLEAVLQQARSRLPLPAKLQQQLDQAGEQARNAIKEKKQELLRQGEKLLLP